MEITRVEARHVARSMWGNFWQQQKSVRGPNPMSQFPQRGNGWSWYTWPQGVVVVRVALADGTTGIGYAEDGIGAATAMVNEHLGRIATGLDARATEQIWEQLYRSSIVYGRKGAAIEAISAIDIAIWDALGKTLGQPVYQLLGGYHGKTVRAYASKVQPDDDLSEVRRMARDYTERGYTGVKANWPYGPADGRRGVLANLRYIEAIRDEIGDDIELMSDAYMGWDRAFATDMLRGVAKFDLRWVEEPLIPDDVEGHAALRGLGLVPIATGEHEFTRYGFQHLIDAGAADVLQPDVHRVGGITELRRVCQMASGASIDVIPHVYSAATLHVVLSQPNCTWIEHLTNPSYWGGDQRVEPLFLGEPAVINGHPEFPTEPGIGLHINDKVMPELADWATDEEKPTTPVSR
ncbi:enolase C-terminal domain-like protein [Saccharopolyspora pogona]|uniref:enolase C-terminal domain-like protein n=1 Tax=Saccharopolyspora pogona TaxID=333966 RepID=UPI00168537B2|nr:enolase C-terminal domain-like protein [Saccharopolyspora pogona]